MAEEHQSPSIPDHPTSISTNQIKSSTHSKKNETQRENTLYIEPQPKCYIGVGNNPEL
jgi:hypothetical protein